MFYTLYFLFEKNIIRKTFRFEKEKDGTTRKKLEAAHLMMIMLLLKI